MGEGGAATASIGRPDDSARLPPWGSYEPWSDLIRGAIVWAGMPDPRGACEQLHTANADERLAAAHAAP